jgi:uncharacterized DUF497 family protein
MRYERDATRNQRTRNAYREDHHGQEIVRIVSARAAEKHEIRRYREQAMD